MTETQEQLRKLMRGGNITLRKFQIVARRHTWICSKVVITQFNSIHFILTTKQLFGMMTYKKGYQGSTDAQLHSAT